FLVGKGGFCGLGPGVQTVEHGKKECTPGALAPLIGGGYNIEARLQGEGFILELSEGGGHFVDSHKLTSLPSKIRREISAAMAMISALAGSSSMACFS